MNLECAAGGSAWKRPIVGNQKCLFRFSGSSYHFGEKKGKLRASLDSPGNSCTMRPRRVPSHEEAMNLVRSGTKQPQPTSGSAAAKARLFFCCVSSSSKGRATSKRGCRRVLMPGWPIFQEAVTRQGMRAGQYGFLARNPGQ